MSDLYQVASDAIDKCREDLNAISRDIWSHPELNFEERHAHSAITQFLETRGFPVERNFVLETGFRSVFGSSDDGPHVAILCEYDALPEIGHACGHNLITEVGLAAGIGVKAAFEANGQPLGKVTILGTPAEEGGGGKIDMINADVFKDVDVAMMAHPCPYNTDGYDAWTLESVNVTYHGKASHAAGFPWEGVNALDAAVLCYQNVSCMRQQFKPSWKTHGVINNGGAKPSIIPEQSQLEFYARTATVGEHESLKSKLNQCFQAAATATGCRVEINWSGRPFLDLINDPVISDMYKQNAVKMGVDFDQFSPERFGAGIPPGSTDMGNVSHVVPSIHPMFYIGTDATEHTREFEPAAGDPRAQEYSLMVGKAMAMTALDLFINKDTLLPKILAGFRKC